MKRILFLAVVLGCGDPPYEAPADAPPEPPPDAAAPTLRVRVAPEACSPIMTVHVTRPDGSVVVTADVDAEWLALEVEAGDMLTAVAANEAYSVVGVEPGDEIVVGTPCIETAPAYMLVSWPDYPGTTIYLAAAECGAVSIVDTSLYLPVDPRCAGPTATFVVAAIGGPFPGDVIAWTIAENREVIDQGEVDLAGWLAPHAIELSLAAPPPKQSVRASLSWTLGPFPVRLFQWNESAALEQTIHVPATGRVLASASMVPGLGISEWLAPTESAFSFDGSVGLPRLDAVSYEQATGTIAWYPDPSTATDAVVIRLNASAGVWTIVVPPGSTSFTPPQIANLQLQPGGVVAIFDRPDVTSYAQVRALPQASLTRADFDDAGILPPGEGGVVEWSFQEATLLVSPHVPPNPPGRADDPGRLRAVEVGRDHP